MFKPISSSLKRKEQAYQKDQNALYEITQAMGVFFISTLGLDLQKSGARCEWAEENLTILTDSKALANELTMRLSDLSRFLQERGIRPVRIIIR